MAKYIYPALFTPEENGYFSVDFPDLKSCYTSGENLEDAMENAKDVLALTIYNLETAEEEFSSPSAIQNVVVPNESFATLIDCDTVEYKRFFSSKFVRKNLTIPEWIEEEATQKGLNFSKVLTDALLKELNH